jgi:hypothetical protein
VLFVISLFIYFFYFSYFKFICNRLFVPWTCGMYHRARSN